MKPPILSPEEKRKDVRSEIEMDVSYKSENGNFKGFCRNICKGGIFIESADLLPKDTNVELEFTLPHTTIPMSVNGIVAWVKEKPESTTNNTATGMGVRFNWKYHN